MSVIPAIEPEDRLQEAVLTYLQATDQGQPLDSRTLLQRYSDVATQLLAFLEDESRLTPLLLPLKSGGLLENATAPGPRSFGRYELLEELGRGGMGVVYKARQVGVDRLVALKIVRAGNQATTADLERFRNETQAIAGLDHPHIVPIYDVGEHERQLYYTMPVLEGGSLGRRPSQFRENPRETARLMSAIARAVHHAHQRGVLHRDIKPSNVLLDSENRPFIADFGLAKRLDADASLTETGAVLGTPGYMSPEQALGRSQEVTTASDIYGLGAILYALLAGRPPFQSATLLETLDDVRHKDPEPLSRHNPHVDRDMSAICLKCLEKDPQRRYISASSLAEDLDRWLAGQPVQARSVGRLGRAWRWSRRNPLVASLSGALGVLLIAGIGGLAAGLVTVTRAWHDTEVQRTQAVETAAVLRQQLYVAQMPVAYQHWERGEIEELSTLLATHLPASHAPDLRGFEWRYLNALVEHQPRKQQEYPARGIVYHAAFSPDGTIVATSGQDRTVGLWNSATGKKLATLDGGLQDDSNCAVFFPDGSKLVSASEDGTLRQWDLATHEHQLLPLRFQGPIRFLQMSLDGKRLVVAGRDPLIHILSTTDWSVQQQIKGHASLTSAATLSPDGRWLASAGNDGTPSGRIEVWDLKNAEKPAFTLDFSSSAQAVAYSPDGTLLAAADRLGKVSLWDAATGRPLADLGQHRLHARSVCFSPDGQYLASAGDDGRVRIWSLPDRLLISHFAASPDRVWSISFSPDGQQLLVAADNGASAWQLPPEKSPNRAFTIGAGDIHRVAFVPNSARLAVLSARGEILVGDVDRDASWQKAPVKALVTPDNPGELMFAGQALATLSTESEIVLWHPADQRTEKLLPVAKPAESADEAAARLGAPLSFSLTPDGRRLAACYAEGWLQTWSLPGPQAPFLTRLSPPQATRVLASTDNRTLAVHALGGAYRFFDLAENRWLGEAPGTASDISSWAFSPDGESLALGQSDGTLQVVDVPGGTVRAQFTGHPAAVIAVAFSPDGKTLASSSLDKTVRLWHAGLGQQYYAISSSRCLARALAFSADGTTLVAAGAPDPLGHNLWLWQAPK